VQFPLARFMKGIKDNREDEDARDQDMKETILR
jgi:hypothetical protein